MGLKIPNLDKKDFDKRMQEVMAKLPAYTDKWSDYNSSDPGVTIIELLAWIVDVNSYRLNRVKDEHYLALLNLLGTKQYEIEKKEKLENENELESREDEIIEGFKELKKEISTISKAVTLKDYEYLALQYSSIEKELNIKIVKAKARVDREKNRVSIIVVPKTVDLSDELQRAIKEFLEPKLLLTTKIDIVKPSFTSVTIEVRVQTRYADPIELKREINSTLESFLDPLRGNQNSKGWDFGEDIYIRYIYDSK